MLQDYQRTGTYYTAIVGNRSDFEGAVVMDVGSGSGILSMFAVLVRGGSRPGEPARLACCVRSFLLLRNQTLFCIFTSKLLNSVQTEWVNSYCCQHPLKLDVALFDLFEAQVRHLCSLQMLKALSQTSMLNTPRQLKLVCSTGHVVV